MANPTSMSSAVHVYRRFVPQPVRSAAATAVPAGVRRKVKGGLARTLSRREARLHRRALRRVRRAGLGQSERRTTAPDGRIAHVHTGLTVDLARRLDHDLVTHALDAAEVPWFAVPALDDRRLCLAVEVRDKGTVRRVLRALLEEHTGYVVSVSPSAADTRETPGSHIKAWKHYGRARVIRLTWLRTDPTEGLWVGEDQGIEIEFWTANTDLPHERLIGPRPNRVQRAVPAEALGIEIGLDRLSGYCDIDGDLGPTVTLENFDVVRLEEISFPVDAVLLWRHPTPWGRNCCARPCARCTSTRRGSTSCTSSPRRSRRPGWRRTNGSASSAPCPGPSGDSTSCPTSPNTSCSCGPVPCSADRCVPSTTSRPAAEPAPARPLERVGVLRGVGPRRLLRHGPGHRPRLRGRAPAVPGRHPHPARGGGGAVPARTGRAGAVRRARHPPHGRDGPPLRIRRRARRSLGEASVALHAALPGIGTHLQRLLVRRDVQQLQFFGLGTGEAGSGGGTNAVVRFLHQYYPVPSVFECDRPQTDTEPDRHS